MQNSVTADDSILEYSAEKKTDPCTDVYDFIKELAFFELEYIDDDDNYHCLSSYVKRVDEDSILISPPEKNRLVHNLTHNLKINQEVNIIFKTEKGLLSAVSKVTGREIGTSSGIKLAFPSKSCISERREYARSDLQFRAEILKFTDNTYINCESFPVQTRNISGSGFCYISDQPLKGYYDIHCKIFIPGQDEPVFARCEHISSCKVKINNGEKAYNNALAFIDIAEDDLSRIVKECFRFQIENRMK